jgi:hypothetical protein
MERLFVGEAERTQLRETSDMLVQEICSMNDAPEAALDVAGEEPADEPACSSRPRVPLRRHDWRIQPRRAKLCLSCSPLAYAIDRPLSRRNAWVHEVHIAPPRAIDVPPRRRSSRKPTPVAIFQTLGRLHKARIEEQKRPRLPLLC